MKRGHIHMNTPICARSQEGENACIYAGTVAFSVACRIKSAIPCKIYLKYCECPYPAAAMEINSVDVGALTVILRSSRLVVHVAVDYVNLTVKPSLESKIQLVATVISF